MVVAMVVAGGVLVVVLSGLLVHYCCSDVFRHPVCCKAQPKPTKFPSK